ncbi:hypothetical protein B0H66DRAFT_577336 [Apodospora peruviana]|uniref:Aminoglycoside phosphotransferase domain-containing protein n=1 Tax=Apodospora peruviana TaxID=516989 RepID=A0AAE0M1C1_9PEZI|nr:hypothetical protein B0H66DRAFT_577336 [Apodospora peruviana]
MIPRAERVLPTDTNLQVFPQSSFFRIQNRKRPTPVLVPSLGLVVKYGADVITAELEAQVEAQVLMHERLQGRVAIPEVFGWAEDGSQRFIYMSLVEGYALQARFRTIEESERRAVCKELRFMVNAWRALAQEPGDRYIGQRPLNDIFVTDEPGHGGPFLGTDAVQQIGIHEDVPIVFTHNDLLPSKRTAAGIIDSGQSGWYSSYLESYFDWTLHEGWETSYLPEVIHRDDDERLSMCSYHHGGLRVGI